MAGLRWGIMGTGGIGAAMARTLREVGSEIVAVGSARPGAAEEFAREWEIANPLPNHGAVAEANDVDIVYVATTNDRHRDNVLECVSHAKPVLCEKPLAINASQAREMVEAAEDSGVLLVEAMWMRFQPFMAKLDQLIDAGTIGEVRHVDAVLSFFLNADPTRRWANLEMGGGSLLDLGVYPLTLIHHLLGPPEQFHALAEIGPTGVDMETAVIAKHAGDALSHALCSFRSDGTNEAVVAGSEGRIRVHARFHQSQRLTVERRGELVADHDVGYEGHGFQFEIAEMERCVREGLTESPLRPHRATLEVMEWMDGIRRHCDVVFPQDS